MSVVEAVRDTLPGDAVVFDNYAFDNSIIGLSETGQVVYSYESMINELVEDTGMSIEEAQEWIESNTIQALQYVENAPIVVKMFDF